MLRRLISLTFLAMIAVVVLAIAACGGDDENETLTLSFTGIEPLANGYHYEGWAIIDGSPVSTGKFNVDGNGGLVDLTGGMIENGGFKTGTDLSNATAIVLTIEPNGDTDTIPTDTHYLAGSVENLSADLSVGHSAALGDSFADASGSYILATPTDEDRTNENSGIWFLVEVEGWPPGNGLRLPTLPAGWEYEGWVVIDGNPVTTGRFTDVEATDLGAPFSGPKEGPAFPGEDFLMGAPDGLTFPVGLNGGTAVISIEPAPDDSAAPFTLKPLVGAIPDDAVSHTKYELGNKAGGFPTGTAVIK